MRVNPLAVSWGSNRSRFVSFSVRFAVIALIKVGFGQNRVIVPLFLAKGLPTLRN